MVTYISETNSEIVAEGLHIKNEIDIKESNLRRQLLTLPTTFTTHKKAYWVFLLTGMIQKIANQLLL